MSSWSADDGNGTSSAASSSSWQHEFASLVETTGIHYQSADDPDLGFPFGITTEAKGPMIISSSISISMEEEAEEESLKDQVKGFFKASAEMIHEFAKGCKDVVHQTLATHHDSYLLANFAKFLQRLTFLNDFLPEDRNPLHAWPVILFVFLIALSVLSVNTEPRSPRLLPKKMYIHPPCATLVLLPDGRHMAYHERGVPAKVARFSLVSPHSFLSSRLAGIPGIKESLLEEFGVRLITYDLPGFGESDPHPSRDLNTSAMDILHIVDSVGVEGKFWVVGYSGGGMHAWAALTYIPDRLAGAAMFAPIVNPYDENMTKEERYRIWEKWTQRRKLMYFLARRFPSLLNYFYRRSFLSGEHGELDKWLSLSLGKKDRALIEEPMFKEFWQRDVEESIRQGNMKPFLEEAFLQVTRWGFSLGDIQVQRKRHEKGILPWLKSMYSQTELEWAGFLGPIHLWQGMDDQVVSPSTAEFVGRLVPRATVHELPTEGHFSYFCFCDECHRQIFSTLFGAPQGPLNSSLEEEQTSLEEEFEEVLLTDSAT